MRCRHALTLLSATAIGLTMGLSALSPAQAEQPTMNNISGPELVALMQGWGYRAELGVDDYDDPMISSSAAGVPFDVIFYDCNQAEPKRCESLMISTGFDFEGTVELSVANDWNLNNRFGRAYIDEEGDPIIELDYEMLGGVTPANIEQTFKYWEASLGDFSEKIGWR